MAKTYSVICPDPDCETSFDIEMTPEDLADGGDLIECPECGEEWEWTYDSESGELQLLADELESLDGDPELDDNEPED